MRIHRSKLMTGMQSPEAPQLKPIETNVSVTVKQLGLCFCKSNAEQTG